MKSFRTSLSGLSLSFIAFFSFSTQAIEWGKSNSDEFNNEFRFFMEGALHKGGDTTEQIPFYDRNLDTYFSGIELQVIGNYNGIERQAIRQDKIEAGGYFRYSVGAEFPLADNLTVSTSIGYKWEEIEGDLTDGSGGRGTATYRRTMADLLIFYNYKKHRIGLGGTLHYNPKFDFKAEGGNFVAHSVYRFSNAVGATVQYDYSLTDTTSMGLRYTDISYDFEDVTTSDFVNGSGTMRTDDCINNCESLIDASNIGAHITYRF